MRIRVAITGIGMVTPVGNDVATTWAALLAGKSGAAPISLFDARGFSTKFGAEVKNFDVRSIEADRKLLKFANRSHKFALAAAEQALGGWARAPPPQHAAPRGGGGGGAQCGGGR
jgi:3-oxoacyl-[acyl-carrier-protein] synthase II